MLSHIITLSKLNTQTDSESQHFLLLDEILDYKKLDNAVEKLDESHVGHNENQYKLKTTKG